jgi:DNA-binding transcriptional ArsR family regulator
MISFQLVPVPPSPVAEVEVVRDHRRAAALLHPLRLRILRQAEEPGSATEIAARLGLPRQRVNYHFRQLIRASLLRPAGRRRKRNMVEKRYVASARGYALSPEVVGEARADWRRVGDTRSPAYLIALLLQAESDLGLLLPPAGKGRSSAAMVSLKTQFRLPGLAERERFAQAVREALADVVFRHTLPAAREDGGPAPGQLHRMVLACYPYEPEGGAGA